MMKTLLTGSLAVAAVAFSLTTASAQGYTAEQEQLCTGDAMALCSHEIPDVQRITACMIAKRAQLSPGCKAVFRAPQAEPQATPVRASKPLNIAPTRQKPGV